MKPDLEWLSREFAAHPEAEFRMVVEVERPMPPTKSFSLWRENPQFFATVEDMQSMVDDIEKNCTSRGEQLWRVRACDRQGLEVQVRYTRPRYRPLDWILAN